MSYGNIIDVFLPEKELKKQVMSIVTDSTPLEEPKNPDTCHVFALYKLLASREQVDEMRKLYLAGGYGYGHAKKALLEVMLERFSEERKGYDYWMSHPDELEAALLAGAQKAAKTGKAVLNRFRTALGF